MTYYMSRRSTGRVSKDRERLKVFNLILHTMASMAVALLLMNIRKSYLFVWQKVSSLWKSKLLQVKTAIVEEINKFKKSQTLAMKDLTSKEFKFAILCILSSGFFSGSNVCAYSFTFQLEKKLYHNYLAV